MQKKVVRWGNVLKFLIISPDFSAQFRIVVVFQARLHPNSTLVEDIQIDQNNNYREINKTGHTREALTSHMQPITFPLMEGCPFRVGGVTHYRVYLQNSSPAATRFMAFAGTCYHYKQNLRLNFHLRWGRGLTS